MGTYSKPNINTNPTHSKAETAESVKNFLDYSKAEFIRKLNQNEVCNMSVDDFELSKTLGVGTFGRVLFVQQKPTKTYYAMKIISKKKVVRLSQVEHTLSEKRNLRAVSYPFIVSLLYHFKDNSNLYLVMEFVPGGELFTYLSKAGHLSESHANFYAAQIAMAFQYLHYLDLIYRDLKPENILIDAQGYVKICDFGLVKQIKDRTWTFCGTPEYLAPEIILAKGYNKSVDWWAFGVLIFEMVAGHPPFQSNNPMKIYEQILTSEVYFPSRFSTNLKNLLRKLLEKDMTKRYGNLSGGINDIKDQEWFRMTNWISIFKKKIPAPFIPQIKGPNDTSYYEDYEELPLEMSTTNYFVKEFNDF
ncbi:cAMP-dependent protein kinase catalytic subunit 1-like [Scaptodrosophila lebanonensis]|uniref:cAMP-dependent protein kinase catalytic subunit 1-like n=1 Tax=Drosophila lebanonensis TaxID=7225 RepID=A0A6J2U9M7_DROLE|nr:cAMP-dependent protein kinase catalytic subunit 1-like [Scaptodrosophila lebanonensis]